MITEKENTSSTPIYSTTLLSLKKKHFLPKALQAVSPT